MKNILLLGVCVIALCGMVVVSNSEEQYADQTWYQDFAENSDWATAINAEGSDVITFAHASNDLSRSTYIDADGVVQPWGADGNNVPRITYGAYGTSGFVSSSGGESLKGFLVEQESRNLIWPTDGTLNDGTDWNSWTVTEAVSGTIVYDVVSIPELVNISGATSQRIQYTGIVTDVGTEDIDWKSGNTEISSFEQDDPATVSVYLRSQTGITGVGVILKIFQRDAAGILGSNDVSSDLVASITSSWRKFSYYHATDDADVSRVSIAVAIQNFAEGDTCDLEIACPQIENGVLPTSYIPTTVAPVTRPADVMTAPIASNRTANEETIYVGFVPLGGDFANDGVERNLLETDTKHRRFVKYTSDAGLYLWPNKSDSSPCVTYISSPDANVFYSLCGICKHISPFVSLYSNATFVRSDTDDYVNPAWGTTMYIGCNANTTAQLNGIIKYIAFHENPHTQHEITYWTNYYNGRTNR